MNKGDQDRQLSSGRRGRKPRGSSREGRARRTVYPQGQTNTGPSPVLDDNSGQAQSLQSPLSSMKYVCPNTDPKELAQSAMTDRISEWDREEKIKGNWRKRKGERAAVRKESRKKRGRGWQRERRRRKQGKRREQAHENERERRPRRQGGACANCLLL